ncbi:MAG: hypothetical protein WC007_07815 [Pelobacteraceae bacterium]
MPEGTVICIMLVLFLFATVGVVVYCLRLARKYKRVEADMQCIHEGAEHNIVDIIYDGNDWFMRKVRLHTDTYPYVVDVPISEVKVTPLRNRGESRRQNAG